MGNTLLHHDFERVVYAAAQWDVTPDYVPILGILAKGLRDRTVKRRVRQRDSTGTDTAVACCHGLVALRT